MSDYESNMDNIWMEKGNSNIDPLVKVVVMMSPFGKSGNLYCLRSEQDQ